eukprot:1002148-Prymnesium_polylepis.1
MISNPWGRVGGLHGPPEGWGFPMGPRGKGWFPRGLGRACVWRALVFVCSRASDLDRCPLRRRVPQRGARAPPPLNPPLLVCAGA